MLLTAGERVSMSLLAMALEEEGVAAISFTGSQSGIITDNVHNEAKIVDIRAHRIQEKLDEGKVVIVAGFQGVSRDKEITTLGRGGSDTTAIALAAALDAEACEILTDVDGLFTADPRIVGRAKLIESCSYDEAIEFASLGAKMHSRSLELAKKFKVNVKIASSYENGSSGTRIDGTQMEKATVRGIASRGGFHFFRTQVSLSDLLKELRSHQFPLRFFHYTGNDLSFLVAKDKAPLIRKSIKVTEEIRDIAIVSAVGEGLAECPNVLPNFLQTIQTTKAPCYLMCLNSLSMVAAIPTKYKEVVTQRLHRVFVEEKKEDKNSLTKKEEPPWKRAPQIERDA